MKYLSVCSGIEAASAAWLPLGWTPAAFSEIEPFPQGKPQPYISCGVRGGGENFAYVLAYSGIARSRS